MKTASQNRKKSPIDLRFICLILKTSPNHFYSTLAQARIISISSNIHNTSKLTVYLMHIIKIQF